MSVCHRVCPQVEGTGKNGIPQSGEWLKNCGMKSNVNFMLKVCLGSSSSLPSPNF